MECNRNCDQWRNSASTYNEVISNRKEGRFLRECSIMEQSLDWLKHLTDGHWKANTLRKH